ncbi:MAG: primosomal protein N' [Leptospiraceae bacterium]|nr:MAG: primosomal protein N' [Leptospiraceae bacterium]
MYKIAKVVFPYPIEEEYDYIIPESLIPFAEIGKRVYISLKNRKEEGIIIKIFDVDFLKPDIQYKEVLEIPDEYPVLNQEQIELAYWMSKEYLCEVGEALDKMYPKPYKLNKTDKKNLLTKNHYDLNLQNLVQLSDEQERVLESIKQSLNYSIPSIHLIQGITGSGKTEIYLYLIVETLKNNKDVLFIVPEISITVQMVERIKRIVGNNIAILHSSLTGKQRFLEYLKIYLGNVNVVLGTRSAIFAPLKNLGLIIIDEEHDSSLRDNSHPRYDARLIARKRIEKYKIPLILGSATPRIEIRYVTEKYNQKHYNGFNYHLYFLHKRVLGKLPEVNLIERDDVEQPISNQLLYEIEKNYKNKKQSLILLNRRGYYPYLYCKNCKKNIQCPNCSISLSLHKNYGELSLKCHYCNYHSGMIYYCPDCKSRLVYLGTGIQKVEEFLLNLFPDLRIERLDTDIANKEKILKQVVQDFIDGKIDILTGTQMISKGIDAPNLNLVGVLQADAGFYLPDFRSSERTFSLLVQVAGRSGRRENTGKVFLEVFDKDHPYIQWAVKQDYESFYKEELKKRLEYQYPPFTRLIRFLIRSPIEKKAERYCYELSNIISQLQKDKIGMYEILGPSPAPIIKLHNKYRYHILIKTRYFNETINTLRESIKTFKKKLPQDHYLEIEIDPVDIL